MTEVQLTTLRHGHFKIAEILNINTFKTAVLKHF